MKDYVQLYSFNLFSLFPSLQLSVIAVAVFSLRIQTLLCLKERGGWAVRVHSPT